MANYPGSNSLINAQRGAESVAGDRQRSSLDNLLRRELHVGDPTDPRQIAQALSERYQGDLRAQAIDGEARGMPFLNTPMQRPVDISTPTATNLDLEQSRSDLQTDLQKLIADNLTKAVRPELEGWQSVIQRSSDEGIAAARFGLDPVKRDTAFAMRRQLGEYARLSRMVGALTPALNSSFRDLAESIDEVCAVMLVIMGESMANVGFAGGRFLLQAPYSELQARRDAVLNSLRQIEGVSDFGLSRGVWPRGLRSYRQMYTVLEAKGQGDIRSLLSEGELARTMDELIQLAGGGSSSGMRALGATAWAPLNRLTRFVQTTIRQIAPTSPEVATLQEALQLFIEGFVPAGGFRLLRVARPTVLNYGLYGPGTVSEAENRLIALVNHRGNLARRLDCLTACTCDEDTVIAQIVLDKMLYDIDRAVDFYAAGDIDFGLPEARAAACSHMLDFLLRVEPWPAALAPVGAHSLLDPLHPGVVGPRYLQVIADDGEIATALRAIRQLLRPIDTVGDATRPAVGWRTTPADYTTFLSTNKQWPGSGPASLRFAQVLHDELCLQSDTDQQWRPVIEQMTSGCLTADRIFDLQIGQTTGCLPAIVDCALLFIDTATVPAGVNRVRAECAEIETILPRTADESLDTLASTGIRII